MALVKPTIEGDYFVLSTSDKKETVKFPIDVNECNGNLIQCKYESNYDFPSFNTRLDFIMIFFSIEKSRI